LWQDLEKYAGLILALHTAQATDLILDQEATECDDLLDAFGLVCPSLITYNTNNSAVDPSCYPKLL